MTDLNAPFLNKAFKSWYNIRDTSQFIFIHLYNFEYAT